ncbi:hypothetical protein PIB30_041434 [Stylosanthes scabra]|uniref:Uncharacterized protein n=1 Tax=Stylosanthes scabra TaxID=79078 RepID=A0ABU6XDB9_9FABA|nr:hypothetical protein [Stylosanthes scabra]
MARTRSNPQAKGKEKVYRPPTRASPRLAALRSQGTVQLQVETPAAPAAGAKPSRRRSQQIAALHSTSSQVLEEHKVIAISSDSEPHEKDKDMEADAREILPAAEGGNQEVPPEDDVYAAIWALLDAHSDNDAEEIPDNWNFDGDLDNWGKAEADVGLARNDQGPPPAEN